MKLTDKLVGKVIVRVRPPKDCIDCSYICEALKLEKLTAGLAYFKRPKKSSIYGKYLCLPLYQYGDDAWEIWEGESVQF